MKSFKVGTFNLYNLVLPNHIYYGNKKYSDEDFDKKVQWIGNQVEKMDTEILGFQEIFHREALVSALGSTHFSAEHIHVLGETGNSPVVGLATTFPLIGEAESISQIPEEVTGAIEGVAGHYTTFSRPVLKARLQLEEDLQVTVIVAHLKSKRPSIAEGEDNDDFLVKAIGQTRSLLRRSVEATGLRKLVLDALSDNDEPVIVIGDLNDATHSVTSSIIAGPMPWKFDSLEKKKKYWDRALYSAFDIIALKSFKNEWPTHIYNGHYEELDHIYVSQEFFFRNKDRLGDVNFVHVLDDHLKDDTLSRDKLPKWQSDHGQVVASVRFRE